jgi:hypothetical protein
MGEGRLVAAWLAIEVRRRRKHGGLGSVTWACQQLAKDRASYVDHTNGRWSRDGRWQPLGSARSEVLQAEGWRELHKRATALLKLHDGAKAHWDSVANQIASIPAPRMRRKF